MENNEYINTFNGGCLPIHDKCSPEYSVLDHHLKDWIVESILELQHDKPVRTEYYTENTDSRTASIEIPKGARLMLSTDNATLENMNGDNYVYVDEEGVILGASVGNLHFEAELNITVETGSDLNIHGDTTNFVTDDLLNITASDVVVNAQSIEFNKTRFREYFKIKTANGDYIRYNPSLQDYEYLSESGVPDKFIYSIDANGRLINVSDNSMFAIYWPNSGWFNVSAKKVHNKGITLSYVSPNAPNIVRALVFTLPNATGLLVPGKLYPINSNFEAMRDYPIDLFTPYFELVPVCEITLPVL